MTTSEVLEILNRRGIEPHYEREDVPNVGEIQDGETVYATTLSNVFHDSEFGRETAEVPLLLYEMQDELTAIIASSKSGKHTPSTTLFNTRSGDIPCAWYAPLHYFGPEWGIYIREACLKDAALNIARFVDWQKVDTTSRSRIHHIALQLLRAAFYSLYLHEHFHHRIESLGFRLLIATGNDIYRSYKHDIYRPVFLTTDCLEESLANADSYHRSFEGRYIGQLSYPISKGLREYLRTSFPFQPPGYREAVHYLTKTEFRQGLHTLQAQVLERSLAPVMPPGDWAIAPRMATGLMPISSRIYVILPKGRMPAFPPSLISPLSVSTRQMTSALQKHYGYSIVAGGGKGSHVKLAKPGGKMIILPGNRKELTPGVLKSVMENLGGGPITEASKVLSGQFRSGPEHSTSVRA